MAVQFLFKTYRLFLCTYLDTNLHLAFRVHWMSSLKLWGCHCKKHLAFSCEVQHRLTCPVYAWEKNLQIYQNKSCLLVLSVVISFIKFAMIIYIYHVHWIMMITSRWWICFSICMPFLDSNAYLRRMSPKRLWVLVMATPHSQGAHLKETKSQRWRLECRTRVLCRFNPH